MDDNITTSSYKIRNKNLKFTNPVNKKKEKDQAKKIFIIKKVGKRHQRLKNKLPFLRYFNPQFTKRENIDKKILREFKNFLREKLFVENSAYTSSLVSIPNISFWAEFVNQNLLPPMEFTIQETNEKIVFKSFNTNYLNWIFSIEGAEDLYDEFIKKHGDNIIAFLIKRYELQGCQQTNDEIHQLDFYIRNIIEIYKKPEYLAIINKSLDEDNMTKKESDFCGSVFEKKETSLEKNNLSPIYKSKVYEIPNEDSSRNDFVLTLK